MYILHISQNIFLNIKITSQLHVKHAKRFFFRFVREKKTVTTSTAHLEERMLRVREVLGRSQLTSNTKGVLKYTQLCPHALCFFIKSETYAG